MDSQLSLMSGGIPILPPLITSDLNTEIQYYKQLAIAVEQKLKILEVAREAVKGKLKHEPDKGGILECTDLIASVNSNLNNTVQNMTSLTDGVIYSQSGQETENLIDIGNPAQELNNSEVINKNISESEPKQKGLIGNERDDFAVTDDKSCMNDTLLVDSVGSDTITASTDLNQYLNSSFSTKTDTSETTPENWKPQVPKTLDIVPITLCQIKSVDGAKAGCDEPPKLVRQGSYVLDAPSPVLIAHMQSETGSTAYTPTSSSQSIKRKDWSISQSKVDWKTPTSLKESMSARVNSNRFRKSSVSNIPCQRVCKSVSNSKTGSPLDVYQPTRSVDCIQAMFAKECNSPKTANSKTSVQSRKYSSPASGTNGYRNGSCKKPVKNSSILSLADKYSVSMGSISSSSPKPVKRVEKKSLNDTNMKKSSGTTPAKSSDSVDSVKYQKPVITSEKILTVFKEIQDTHKKQMLELMTRQQKEQMLMQENFKKQQILLLAQIRKAFPEISVTSLTEAVTSKNAVSAACTPASNKKSDTVQHHTEMNGVQFNGIKEDHVRNQTFNKSADYPELQRELSSSSSCDFGVQVAAPNAIAHSQISHKENQMNNNCTSISTQARSPNFKNIDDIPVGVPVRRHSSVSRQLFPLDNRKCHTPLMNLSDYSEKHVRAATKITAYAKGFLVRRLMKTEKVIALKNTYREALHCMLRLHVDAPLNLPELNFHQRLQLQCDSASMDIVDLFSQSPAKRMEMISHDREIKRARCERPSSARSYSFATQRTLARKKLKEMGVCASMQSSIMTRSCPARTRSQTWASNAREKRVTTSMINRGMTRSTSAGGGAERKPWR
ncbi:hypothetical protein QAD02_015341 [Eretmocerus hayati]|uniref:Uncharacterized protein n=1 Tax=Eretmocerus hayati TaxID=131215 RepID=A0ACC2P7J6_9HYME|nr:hypothetical protein QAD02_015341 [Eretmocerus hayati]